MITIVLPVYNEELVLRQNAIQVFEFCAKNLKDEWQIIISDNNSDDNTREIGEKLADKYREITYFYIKNQGKGYGVIKAWQEFESDIYIYMDTDLSADLKSLPELIEGIRAGYDIVVGSRFVKGAQVEKSWFRQIVSRGLRVVLKLLFKLKVKDAPCGFKAVSKRVVDEILLEIQNKTWFFDTEMLILAEKANLKIKEIPVDWTEVITRERESKVGMIAVILDYIKNIYFIYVKNAKILEK